MPRQKKEGKIVNFYLSVSVIQKLEEFCAETGMSKTVAVERLVTKGIDEYNESIKPVSKDSNDKNNS